MRLIDADVLMEDVRNNSESYFADDFAHEWVDRQPTIDAVEMVHAYWKNDHKSQSTPLKDGYYCSACGEPAITSYNGAVRTRWCPWCGARMDGRRMYNASPD